MENKTKLRKRLISCYIIWYFGCNSIILLRNILGGLTGKGVIRTDKGAIKAGENLTGASSFN